MKVIKPNKETIKECKIITLKFFVMWQKIKKKKKVKSGCRNLVTMETKRYVRTKTLDQMCPDKFKKKTKSGHS